MAMNALIIDDNADIRLLVDRVLAMIGIDCTQAPGGREALELLTTGFSPEIIVLDVQMPIMDGWETLRRIRTETAARATPVILCTVKGGADDILRGWELGCDAYVSKPFDVRALMSIVRDVAARTALERLAIRAAETENARRAVELAASGKR